MAATARRRPATQADAARSKDATINMRIDTRARDLIDLAASTLGRSRTDFMIESAVDHAKTALMDRVLFPLESQAFKAFSEALDKPLPPNSKLKKLMRRKPAWDAQ